MEKKPIRRWPSRMASRTLVILILLSNSLAYQNCAKVNFTSTGTLVGQSTSASTDSGTYPVISIPAKPVAPTISIEDGAYATNKKVLKISFSKTAFEYSEMRLATDPAKFSESMPWVPYSDETTFDLNTAWEQGGKKDGIKKIYGQFRISANSLRELENVNSSNKLESEDLQSQAEIGLDTLTPEMNPLDLLKLGLQGKIFKQNEVAILRWQVKDKVSVTGYSSGLNEDTGMRVGYAMSADCSEKNVTWETDWSTPKEQTQLAWPVASPVDNFYVCILAKDRAGNISSYLSQPLTGLWKVFAGDNNQGNGGSAIAPNVRFGRPGSLGMDSKKNLYISDSNFNNIRRVRNDGTIELVLGQGPFGGIAEGVAIKSNFRGGSSPLFDSKDRAYFVSSNLYRLSKDESTQVETVRTLINADGCRMAVAMKRKISGDVLYIHNICSAVANDAPSKSLNYLLAIPVADIDKFSGSVSIKNLINSYKILGSGTVAKENVAPPMEIVLGKNDPVDDVHSLSVPASISIDDQGIIYLLTQSSFNTSSGDRSLRRLIPKPDGSYLQQRFANGHTHASSITIVGNTLFLVCDLLYSFDVTKIDGKNLLTMKLVNIPEVKNVNSFLATEDGYYIADDYKSRIFFMDKNFKPFLTLGRPTYSTDDKVADMAMLSRPQGITQTALGNTYFVDMLNQLIRKIDAQGNISTVAGSIDADITSPKIFAEVNLSTFQFGRIPEGTGSRFRNIESNYDQASQTETLFMSDDQMIHILNLKNGKAQTILGSEVQSYTVNNKSPLEHWRIGSFALFKSDNGLSLVTNRFVSYPGPNREGMQYGWIAKTDLSSNGLPASIETTLVGKNDKTYAEQTASISILPQTNHGLDFPLNQSTAMKADSLGITYFNSKGFFATKLLDRTHPVSNILTNGSPKAYTAVEVFEEGHVRHVFALDGNNLQHFQFDVRTLFGPSAISVKPEVLCLPGTFWNYPRALTKTIDGNILISDENSARILKYFIRDSSNKIKTVACK